MATVAGVLVDADVLIDIATGDPVWAGWYAEALAEAGRGMRLIVNPIVYAEVSVAFRRIEDLDALLPEALFEREAIPWEAAFLAGKVFLNYRRRGGIRSAPLPGFFIGAHAAVKGYRLLSRDRGRFAGNFPTLEIIAPD